MFEGTEREFVVQETVMTKVGIERVLTLRLNSHKKKIKAFDVCNKI